MAEGVPRWSYIRRQASAWLRWALLLASGACAAAPPPAPAVVQLVLSADSAPYLEFASALTRELGAANPPVRVQRVELQALERGRRSGHALSVAAGLAASRALAAQGDDPVVYAMLPAAALDSLRGNGRREHTAVLIDQPYDRQMALIRAVLPRAQRLAVVAGPGTRAEIDDLFLAATRAGFTLVLEGVSEAGEIVPALRRALRDADALLALPDPLVFNRNTVHNVLLTTYRYRVPVFAYSEGLLRAGATYAVFTTPADLGTEVGALIRRYLAAPQRGLPPPAHPQGFEVDTNAHVARSLDLPVADADELRRRLAAPRAGHPHE